MGYLLSWWRLVTRFGLASRMRTFHAIGHEGAWRSFLSAWARSGLGGELFEQGSRLGGLSGPGRHRVRGPVLREPGYRREELRSLRERVSGRTILRGREVRCRERERPMLAQSEALRRRVHRCPVESPALRRLWCCVRERANLPGRPVPVLGGVQHLRHRVRDLAELRQSLR